MRMFPRPHPGTGLGLCHRAIWTFLCIDKLYIAVVRLRLLIQKFENPLSARGCHNDGIHLLADLCDGLRKVLVQSHKRDDRADCHSRHSVQRQKSAHNRAEHIA